MVRLVRFSRTGGPEVLSIDTVDLPRPGPNEVQLRVVAIGLNRAESMWRAGRYVDEARFPARIGYEASGVVEFVGSEVRELAVGDAVSVIPGFSQSRYGTYGDHIVVPAAMAVKHPSRLSFAEAASIWMMFITAYGGLIETAKLVRGETVLIPGASSSVGLAAIQIANSVGARPIALTRTAAKTAQLLENGAAATIVTDTHDVIAEVRKLTGGRGAEVVFDPVAGPGMSDLIEATSSHGRYVLYGALSSEPTTIPVLKLLSSVPTIFSYKIFDTTTTPSRLTAAIAFVEDGFTSGQFKSVIDRRFQFEDIVNAHRYLEANEQFGKIVVAV